MSVAIQQKMYTVPIAFDLVLGAKPAAQTISRLCRTGELKAYKALGSWHCSLEAVRDYMEKTTERHLAMEKPAIRGSAKTRSEAKRQRDIAVANATLEEAGVK